MIPRFDIPRAETLEVTRDGVKFRVEGTIV